MSEKPILVVNGKSYDEPMHWNRRISVQVFDLTLTETWEAMHLAPAGERQQSSKGKSRLQGKASVNKSLSVAGSDKVFASHFQMTLEPYDDENPPLKDRATLEIAAGYAEHDDSIYAFIGNEAYNELVSAVRSPRRFSLSISASLDDAWVNKDELLHFRPIEGREHCLLARGLITALQISEPSVKLPPIQLSWRDEIAIVEQNKDTARIAASSRQARALLVEITRKSKAASAALMEDHKASEQRYQESVEFLESLISALNPKDAADSNGETKAGAHDFWRHQKLEDIFANGNGRFIDERALNSVADEYLKRRWLHSAEIELIIVDALAYNDTAQFGDFSAPSRRRPRGNTWQTSTDCAAQHGGFGSAEFLIS
jgi:hypothetical protein